MVELREISIIDENMKECISLEVASEQIGFVAHNAASLGHAYSWNARYNASGVCAVPYAIYADDIMVGFIMYGFLKQEIDEAYDEDCYYLWRFMVDEKHQGKGYGKQALAQLIGIIKQYPQGKVDHCYVSYKPANTAVKKLYESFGFSETGKEDDGELIARLKL